LATRRAWRSAPENDAPTNVRAHSTASFHADHAAAETEHVEIVVLHALVGRVRVMGDRGSHALTLLAATDAPMPEPQMRMPRSAAPPRMASARRSAKSG